MIQSKKAGKKVLLVPAVKQKHGLGHLKRSLLFLNELSDQTYIYIPADSNISHVFIDDLKNNAKIIQFLNKEEKWDMVVLDKMKTSKTELHDYYNSKTIIGLDEGGKYRKFFPCLIDTVLNPLQKEKPNIVSALFKKYNKKIKEKDSFRKILISFGGEDPYNLSNIIVSSLISKKIVSPEAITIIQGPLFAENKWPSGINVIKNPQNLSELLSQYDLVITHFGITCFQSIFAGIPVVLFNPTPYHQKLCNYYKLPNIGMKKPDKGKIKQYFFNPGMITQGVRSFRLMINHRPSVLDVIKGMYPHGNSTCPVCRKSFNKVIERFSYRSYFYCRSCKIIYSIGFKKSADKYTKDYFFKEYKNQYGKTYLEDFENIKNISHTRTSIIKLMKSGKKTLLDIGCAYGPFLSAAKEAGFYPEGIDISPDAAEYVNNTLNITCRCANFAELLNGTTESKKYDVITMWFVLEHFVETDVILRKVNKYMNRGGIFAFSSPSYSGISYKKNKRTYLKNNPDDHYTLWNPKAVKKILPFYGFKIVKIKNTGHHPERFPFVNKWLKVKDKNFLYDIINLISRIGRLGDTFEVYAQKVHGIK